ncbi:hypothetical protein HY484_02450 [Candidatus Woesearchaeota archaeon]|nr:hypothetical protein [Candidatus Woesearchaeota archaeon]
MKKVMPFFVVLIFLVSSIAVVAQSAFTWEQYVGSSQWRVSVTEDESGCGGGVKTTSVPVQINHNMKGATVGNWAHGTASGTFSGNTLSLPQRTIPDEGGMSKLHAFNLEFTPDCSGFVGSYRWDYRSQYQSCSGSTGLRGTSVDGKGCPVAKEQKTEVSVGEEKTEVNVVREGLDRLLKLKKEMQDLDSKMALFGEQEINAEKSSLRAELYKDLNRKVDQMEVLQPKVEANYRKILNKDPDNFWANWDMAELEKSRGNHKAYFDYFDRAVTNERTESVSKELKKKAAVDLGLSEFPTILRSPAVKKISDDMNSRQGVNVYNVNVDVPKEPSKWEKFKMKVWTAIAPDTRNVVNEIVGLPKE